MKILCCFVRRSLQSPQAHGALGGERGELSGGREPGRVLAMCKTCAGKAEASLSFRSVGPEDAENPFQQGGAGGGLAMRSLYKLAERGVPGSCCEEPHGSVLSCVLHIVLVSSLASLRYPAHVSTCQGATMLPALPRRCQQRQQLRAKVHCTVSVTSKYIAPNLRAK